MFQNIGNDVRQIFLRHQFLFIAQLDDTFGNLAHGILVQLQPQVFQVLADIRLAAVLAQRILPLTTEAFGQEVVAVQVAFIISVGMHARHLRKHILTHNRFVGGNYDARIRLHHTAHIIEAALVDIGDSAEMVFQDGLHAGKRRIPGTLAQTVNGGVQPLATAQHGCQHIAHRKVVIIVRMEVEMRVRIAFHHFPHEFNDLQRVQHPQRIGQHIPLYVGPDQCVHQLKHIFGRIFHAVAPVLQVDVHLHVLHVCVVHHCQNIFDMFFGQLLQLAGAMLQRAFAQQVNDAAAGSVYPVHRRMPVYEPEHFHPRQHIAAGGPVAYHFHRIELPFRHPRGSHFHPVRLQVFKQQTGYHQLLMGHERHSAGLFAVAERGVHDFYLRMIMLHVSSPRILFCLCSLQGNLYRPIRSSGSVSCRH